MDLISYEGAHDEGSCVENLQILFESLDYEARVFGLLY